MFLLVSGTSPFVGRKWMNEISESLLGQNFAALTLFAACLLT